MDYGPTAEHQRRHYIFMGASFHFQTCALVALLACTDASKEQQFLAAVSSPQAVSGETKLQPSSGPGSGKGLTFSPSTGAFGSVTVGQSASIEMSITNSGGETWQIKSPSSSDTAFTIAKNTCTDIPIKADETTCAITIKFTPTDAKTYAGEMKYMLTDSSGKDSSASLALSGTGTALTSGLASVPAIADFGSVSTATTGSKSFVISNAGKDSETISSVKVTGSGYTLGAETCTGKKLDGSAASCSVPITFAPKVPGTLLGLLTITYSGQGGSGSFTLSLTGIGDSPQPSLTISPSTWNYGSVATNATSSKTFTVSNNTTVSAIMQTASVAGSNYTLVSDACSGTTLTAGGSCNISVTFAPAAVGAATATITVPFISAQAIAGSSTVSLSGTGATPTVSFSFAGFNGGNTSSITATGVVLSWTAQSSASYYKLFQTTGGTTTVLATITPTTTASYSVSGLTPNTSYTFKINAYDAGDISDGNTNTASVTTANTTGATFNGWADVIATGPVSSNIGTIDAAVAAVTLITSAAAQVKIAWEVFTFTPSGAASGYKIYRASGANHTWPGDFTLIDTIGATEQYTDNTVVASTTYYYRVHPLVGAGTELTPATEADSVIQVFVPTTNMALMHRWIANRETCVTLLGKTFATDVDRTNNYRCAYTWGAGFAPQVAAADKTRWDIGHSLVVDRWKGGCNMLSYGAGPAGGANGDVYYGQTNQGYNFQGHTYCYIKKAGSWLVTSNASITDAERVTMFTNAPGYPPTRTSQIHASNICNLRSATGVGNLRLLRLYEKVAVAAWNGVFVNPSNTLLSYIQLGTDHTTFGSCNTYNGDSLDPATNKAFIPTANTLINGAWAMRNCKSRYEVYELEGNYNEWAGDQFTGCDTANTCTGAVSALDSGAVYTENFVYDGVMGAAYSGGGSFPGVGGATPIIPMLALITNGVSATLGSRSLTPGRVLQIGYSYSAWLTTPAVFGARFPGNYAVNAGLYLNSGYGSTGRMGWTIGATNADSDAWWPAVTGFRCVGEVGP